MFFRDPSVDFGSGTRGWPFSELRGDSGADADTAAAVWMEKAADSTLADPEWQAVSAGETGLRKGDEDYNLQSYQANTISDSYLTSYNSVK